MVNTYLFLLVPAGCGGSKLHEILDTSHNISTFLEKRFKNHLHKAENRKIVEGHNILSFELDDTQERNYNLDYKLPVEKVKFFFDEYWDHSKLILCDKSVSFIHFAKEIEEYFSKFGDIYFISMCRNPYAQNWESDEWWVRYTKNHINCIKTLKNILHFTYEDFVTNPEQIKTKILNFLPILENINMKVDKNTRGIKGEKITNQFRDRIIQKDKKNNVLQNYKEYLEFFGYDYIE